VSCCHPQFKAESPSFCILHKVKSHTKSYLSQNHYRLCPGRIRTHNPSKQAAARTNGMLKGDTQYARLHVTMWDPNCRSQKNTTDTAQHNIRKCCCSRSKSSMMSHFITVCIVPDVSMDHSAFMFWVKQLKKWRQYDDSQCQELHNQKRVEDMNLQQLHNVNFTPQMAWC